MLDYLTILTLAKQYSLRIDLGDWSGNYSYAEYSLFEVGDASTGYNLTVVGNYTGDVGKKSKPHYNFT